MSFKPVKMVVLFSALAGASLFVSGVASADSVTPGATSNTTYETKIDLTDGQASHQTSEQSSNSVASQSYSDNSQTALVTTTTNSDAGGSDANLITKTLQSSDGSQSTDKTEKSEKTTEATIGSSTDSSTGGASDASSIPATGLDSNTMSKTATLSFESQAHISQALLQSQSHPTAAKLAPVMTEDSGGVAIPAGSAPTPAHPAPVPVDGLQQLTTILNSIVLPVTQLAGMATLTTDILPLALGVGLPILVLMVLIVGSSAFVTQLRRSGFKHGARSDIPSSSLQVVTSLKMSFASVPVYAERSSFLSGLFTGGSIT